ncbi:hypothetical protein ACQPYE_37755 [Actinosynnema sp. CA-299493]
MHHGVHHGPLRAVVALLGRLAAFSLTSEESAETPVGKGTPLRKEFLVAIANPKAGLTRRAKARLDKGTAAVLLGMAGLPATSRT